MKFDTGILKIASGIGPPACTLLSSAPALSLESVFCSQPCIAQAARAHCLPAHSPTPPKSAPVFQPALLLAWCGHGKSQETRSTHSCVTPCSCVTPATLWLVLSEREEGVDAYLMCPTFARHIKC